MSKIEVFIGSPTGGLNSHGKWCSWDDLTDEERIRWVEGQNAAEERHFVPYVKERID